MTIPSSVPGSDQISEVKTLLERHIEKVDRFIQDFGEVQGRHARDISELRGKIMEQGSKILEVERMAAAVTERQKRFRDSQAEFHGGLIAEVGKLASNDKEQNAKLQKIEEETEHHTKKLDQLVDEKAEFQKSLQELIDDKKTVKAYSKAVMFICVAAPGAWSLLQWAAQHIKL